MTEQHHHHYSTQATGFHLKLKEGTQTLHDEAESGNFQIRMVKGELARREFASFLSQMRHIHATLDPALQAAADLDERVAEIFDESHLRLGRIDQDLKDLAHDDTSDPLPATEQFLSYINEKREVNPTSLIGVLYVKEGATNGNKIVAKKLREKMAMGYLDPHGKDQRLRWNAFKVKLNELNLTDQEQEECVSVAQETFRMVMDVSKQMPKMDEATV